MKDIMKVALLMLLAGSIASCNLDKYPDGDAIPEEQAFTTFKDAGQFRPSLYYFARQCFSSYTVIPVNMQAEGINATLDYGNQMGFQYTWTFADNDGYVEQLWTYCYGGIYQINYFIQKANELIERDNSLEEGNENKMTESEREQLNLYIGEARLFRAMINHQLATFYCKDYNPETAKTDWGIILTDKVDVNARNKRSTLFDTYDFINKDLTAGKEALERYYNELGNPTQYYYLSPLTAQCLEAKILLHTDQYEAAATAAAAIADASILINNADAFADMWKNNTNGTEILFQFYASLNEGRSQYGSMFCEDPYNDGKQVQPLYLPSAWLLNLYASNDIRSQVYFRSDVPILSGTTLYTGVKYIAKYPGNPALNTTATTNELMQNVVVYRSADFVLMAAEAYARANNLDGANKYLEKLLTARIPGYTYTPYASIDEVFAAIKQERLKEMFMEGNRIADLKRWGDAMDRTGQDPQASSLVVTTGLYLNIPATDYRFVWPIPQSEKTSNPNISDQLNW